LASATTSAATTAPGASRRAGSRRAPARKSALDQLPPRLIVYGIEGKDFTSGEGLSPEVAAAVEEAAQDIVTVCKTGEINPGDFIAGGRRLTRRPEDRNDAARLPRWRKMRAA